MERNYAPCGGCGATDPIDRCIGCFHPFPELLHIMQDAAASKEAERKLTTEQIEHRRKVIEWYRNPAADNESGKDKLAILKKHYFNYYRPSFTSDERTAEVVDTALSIKEETEAIFKAMDEYAATPQGIGWVKANTRLPAENGRKYFVKFREGKYICYYYNGGFQSTEWGLMDNSLIEWLDEG